MRSFLLLFIFVMRCSSFTIAQVIPVSQYQENFKIHIRHSNTPVKIDGELNDSIWMHAETVSDFFLKFPNDINKPQLKTEIKTAYDDKFLYVAFTCYDSGKNIIQSLKRDIGHFDNDGVGIVLDPQNLHSNGFIFVVNANNAQSEDQLSPSEDDQLSWSWDNKWFSSTKRYAKYWVAEMAIPFKTLRYPPGKIKWGVNFFRVDMTNNEYSSWTKIPLNFRIYNLGYSGGMLWESPPTNPGKNMLLLPYITGGLQSDKENNQPGKSTFNAGMDAKFTLNSSLNLDLTVNPDFSQVEVDQQVTNLTRFNIFFPERRSFFLENADIFGEYGIPGFITPFYSRKIGLDKDGNRIPILGGARLSGNINNATRIGVMDIQTGAKGNYAAENYAAVSVNHNVFGRSVLKGYFLNRESFLTDQEKKADPLRQWGRNAGGSFEYTSIDGKWKSWAAVHHSFKPNISTDNNYLQTGFSYSNRQFSHVVDLVSLGTNYYTDMGFVQRIENYDAVRDTTIRVGFKHIYDQLSYKFFPQSGLFNRHTINFENYIVFNPDYSLNERNHDLTYRAEFKSNSGLEASITNNGVNLLFPTSFTDGKPLPATYYSYNQFSAGFYSDTRKLISYNLSATGGGFYNGTIVSVAGGVNFRKRPHLNIALNAEYNKLQFPGSYGSNELLLISPRIDYNFNTKLFFTTFLQYSTQQNNFNINARLQYRFRPMSDLFIVYADNYFTTPLIKNKNRSIVFKMNYWLNL